MVMAREVAFAETEAVVEARLDAVLEARATRAAPGGGLTGWLSGLQASAGEAVEMDRMDRLGIGGMAPNLQHTRHDVPSEHCMKQHAPTLCCEHAST
jgi:hypothetical protein